jgi:hypothetical protein
MRSSTTRTRLLALAASALVSCAPGDHDSAPPGQVQAPFGAEPQPGVGPGWKIPQSADFNFDGMADVLWNEPEKNLFTVWLVAGTALLAPGPVFPGPPGDGWEAITAGEFNHDGMADVLWGNPKHNLMSVWLMSSTDVLVPGPVIPGPPGDGWTLVPSVGDINFDGMADVIWVNSKNNATTIWLMSGTELLAPGPVIPGPVGPGWVAATVGDFNFDGMVDLVWNNTRRNTASIWLLSGTALLAPGPEIPGPPGDGWTIVPSAGDCNLDGMSDLHWTNATQGLLAVWLMAGTALLAPGPLIPGPPGPGWAVVTNGDHDFNGMQDAVWQASKPARMAIWLMEGTALLAPGPVIPGPTP